MSAVPTRRVWSTVVAICLALGLVPALALAKSANAAAPKDGAPGKDDGVAALQGRWERGKYAGMPAPDAARAVKEIKGNRETVTYYDAGGKVLAVTEAEFKVQAFGPVRVYTFEDLRFVEGPRKGKSERKAVSYAYRLDGDSLHEAHGLLANSPAGAVPSVVTWTRAGGEKK